MAFRRVAALFASVFASVWAAEERIPVPGGQGCNAITDPVACCLFIDNRSDAAYARQECVPSRNGTRFNVNDPTITTVCQPSCWAYGTCGDGGDQSALVGSCPAVPRASEGARMLVPGGQGCHMIPDRAACCFFADGRKGDYGGQDCVPARNNTKFDVEGTRATVCQPSCWADGTCGDRGDQSLRAGVCATPAVAPLPASAVLSQAGARVPAGGDLRFYVVGSSNAAWQSWPDMLHAMLRRLGYNVRLPATDIPGEITGPFGRRTPKCDDAAAFETISTPRLGLQGWSSWGFSYENEDDCDANGYREVAGYNLSCTNGWACKEKYRGKVPLIPPSVIAKGVKDADVLVLANFMNDARTAMFCPSSCFGEGDWPDVVDTTSITAETLKRTIKAVHAENPDMVILVLGRYGDASKVVYKSEPRQVAVDKINAGIREKMRGVRNAHFVDLTFPYNVSVFQSLNRGHANCRGDQIMASTVVHAMFEHKVIERGLDLGDEDECLARADCTKLDLSCCQRSAFCHVASNGECAPYSPGLQ